MQVGLKEKRARFESLNSTGHEFVSQSSASPSKETLRQQLQELNTRWSDLPVLVEEKSAKVKTCKFRCKILGPKFNPVISAVESWVTLQEQINVLQNWFKDVKVFMAAEQAMAVGEPETLKAQLEQFTVSK